jgi:hypothetical protein
MFGVSARPDETDDEVRSAKNHCDDDQLTYRHLKPQKPSQRAEHATMLMAILVK